MPYRRSFSQGAAIFALAALGLAGCGGDDYEGEGLARAVPASSPVYLELATDEPEAYDALRALAGGTGVASDLESFAQRLVGTKPSDVDFATEVEPWLGERAGVFLVAPGEEPIGGVVAEVTDEAEAEAFAQAALADQGTIAEAEYRDVAYTEGQDALAAVEDGVLLTATSLEVFELAVDALLDGGLAGDEAFDEAGQEVAADEALVAVHLDLDEAGSSLEGTSPGTTQTVASIAAALGVDLEDPVALAITAEESVLTVREAHSSTVEAPATALSPPPANAWLALSTDGIGARLPSLLKGLALAGGGQEPAIEDAFEGVSGLTIEGLGLLGVGDRLSVAIETPSPQTALDLGRFAVAILRARGYRDVQEEVGSVEALRFDTDPEVTFSLRESSLLVSIGGRGDQSLAEPADTGEGESGLTSLGLARGEGLAAFLMRVGLRGPARALAPVDEVVLGAEPGEETAVRELRITLR